MVTRWYHFALAFLFFGVGFYFLIEPKNPFFSDGLIVQNTNHYLGPNQPVLGNPQLVKVQILIYNAPNPSGVTIESASLNGKNIPLKPRDIYGYRGQAGFQLKPGTYKLRWKVNKDKNSWPRTIDHVEEVVISPRDLWIQITIRGNEASIS